MSVICATAILSPGASSSAMLFNEGLEPGLRVTVDDKEHETATVCSVETDVAFAHVRLHSTGQRVRVASWRLALID